MFRNRDENERNQEMKKSMLLMLILGVTSFAHAELLLHWDFNEQWTEPNAIDQTMYGRNGVLTQGAVRVNDAEFIGTIGFTGVYGKKTTVRLGPWLDAPMDVDNLSPGFTMAVLWRCQNPVDAPWGVMIGWDGLGLGVLEGGVWSLWSTAPNPADPYDIRYNEVHYADTLTDTDWHHLAITYVHSTNTRSIYLDGVLLGADVLDPADGPGQGYWEKEFTVGGRQDWYETQGLCTDAKVWNTALDASQILAEYNALMAEQKILGDINEDLVVDIDDLAILVQDWLQGCQ